MFLTQKEVGWMFKFAMFIGSYEKEQAVLNDGLRLIRFLCDKKPFSNTMLNYSLTSQQL